MEWIAGALIMCTALVCATAVYLAWRVVREVKQAARLAAAVAAAALGRPVLIRRPVPGRTEQLERELGR